MADGAGGGAGAKLAAFSAAMWAVPAGLFVLTKLAPGADFVRLGAAAVFAVNAVSTLSPHRLPPKDAAHTRTRADPVVPGTTRPGPLAALAHARADALPLPPAWAHDSADPDFLCALGMA